MEVCIRWLMLGLLMTGIVVMPLQARQSDTRGVGLVVGRVLIDGDGMGHVSVHLEAVTASGGVTGKRTTETDEQGRFEFANLVDGEYRVLVSEVCAEKVRVVSVCGGATAPLEINVCKACDGEGGPDIVLGTNDRAAIYADLVRRAFTGTKARILERTKVVSSQIRSAVPDGVEVLGRKQIQARSRGTSIDYVRLEELRVHGSCVEGAFTMVCMADGDECSMSGAGSTFDYRYSNRKWEATYAAGWLAVESAGRHLTNACSGARTTGLFDPSAVRVRAR